MAEQPQYLRPHRAERVIAASRLLLAMFLVIAVVLDPTEPPEYAALLQRLSAWYLIYAALIAILTWARRTTPRHLPLASHVLDLVLFLVFMHLTRAPTSPFFVYFIFATICGAVRWHGRGALLTGLVALVAYVAVTIAAGLYLPPAGDFDAARFITRCTQLAVIAALLAYLGAHQHRLQTEIATLAAWPRQLPPEEQAALRDVLAHAAAVLRVSRMVLVWQEGDEPSTRVAVKDGDEFSLSRERPDVFGSLVAADFQRSSFLCEETSAPLPLVIQRVPGGFVSRRARPLDPKFLARFQVRSVLALRVAADPIDGRLFALNSRSFSSDDILLGDIVGRFVASALEEQLLLHQLQDAAAGEERLRLARELHDGVLQSLTAIALQAERLRAVVAPGSEQAERRVSLIQDTIASQQRAVREMLEELHPGREVTASQRDAASLLSEVAARVSRQWEIEVTCRVAPEVSSLPGDVTREICRMTEEAAVNAIRHGAARRVQVDLASRGSDSIALTVSYRGCGFATFEGRYDLAALTRMQAGPRTLKERVAELGGELVIDSDPGGARVEVVIDRRA